MRVVNNGPRRKKRFDSVQEGDVFTWGVGTAYYLKADGACVCLNCYGDHVLLVRPDDDMHDIIGDRPVTILAKSDDVLLVLNPSE